MSIRVVLCKGTSSEAEFLHTVNYALGIRFTRSLRFYHYILEFNLIFWSLIIEANLWDLFGRKRYMRKTIKKTKGAFKNCKLDTKLYFKNKRRNND